MKINGKVIDRCGRLSVKVSDSDIWSQMISRARSKWGDNLSVDIGAPITPKTDRQNRALHGILHEWYKSGQHNEDQVSFNIFRSRIKARWGVSIDIDLNGTKFKILKSIAEYTKNEMKEFLDGIISEVNQTMIPLSPKMEDIYIGMERNETG